MKQFDKDQRTKCLIKIKKYIALFVVYDLFPHFPSKGLKQEKYFTFKTKTCAMCPSMGANVSVQGCGDCTEGSECLVVVLCVDRRRATIAQQAWQRDEGWRRGVETGGRLDEHQYNASVLLLRGLLIFSMFFRIMSCNVTY